MSPYPDRLGRQLIGDLNELLKMDYVTDNDFLASNSVTNNHEREVG